MKECNDCLDNENKTCGKSMPRSEPEKTYQSLEAAGRVQDTNNSVLKDLLNDIKE